MAELNPKQKRLLEERARETLGDNYGHVARFFLSIYYRCRELAKDAPVIVAFVTRRCHVLSLVFDVIFSQYNRNNRDKWPDYLQAPEFRDFDYKEYRAAQERCYTTDINLVTLSDQIAEYYLKQRRMPYILVADEILWHGRTLNSILSKLEVDVVRALEYRNEGRRAFSALNQLIAALELHIYTRNGGPLLLFSRYQRRLRTYSIQETSDVRRTSRDFFSLISIAPVNNNSYSWSVRVMEKKPPEPVWERMVSAKTTWEGACQHIYMLAYPRKKNPKLLFTFRWKHSNLNHEKKDNVWLGVPFILTGRIPAQGMETLYKTIQQDVPQGLKGFFNRYVDLKTHKGFRSSEHWRRMAEINDLVLCSLFVSKMYLGKLSFSNIDSDMLTRNFTDFTASLEDGAFPGTTVKDELKLLWEFAQSEQSGGLLEKYLCILLEDAEELWNIEGELNESVLSARRTQNRIADILDDEIWALGRDAEIAAYRRQKSYLPQDERELQIWGSNLSLTQAMDRMLTKAQGGLAEAFLMTAMLVQRMDLGIVGISPCPGLADGDADKRVVESSSLELKAGEQSLFIKPTAYQEYLPVLRRIVERCGNDPGDIRTEIRRFARELDRLGEPVTDGLADELYQFLIDLSDMGQELGEWDFSLTENVSRWIFEDDGEDAEMYHELLRFLECANRKSRFMRLYNRI